MPKKMTKKTKKPKMKKKIEGFVKITKTQAKKNKTKSGLALVFKKGNKRTIGKKRFKTKKSLKKAVEKMI